MNRHIAVIGGGYWGKNVVRAFHALDVLHTVCDLDAQVLERVHNDYPGVETSADYAAVLDNPAITAVAIAAPAEHHFTLAQQALRAGKHVFVEKPITTNVAEAESLITLARSVDRVLMVGHLLHYHPMVQALKALVAEGRLGTLRAVRSRRLNFGKLRTFENVLWSFAPHDVSVILGLVGEMPQRIVAQGSAFEQGHIEDMVSTSMSFPGGVQASIEVSWLHPEKEQKLVLVGDAGMAVFDDRAPWEQKLAFYAHRVAWEDGQPILHKADPEYLSIPQSEPLKNECQHFVECCANNAQPTTDGREGMRVLQVLQEMDAQLQAARNDSSQSYFAHETAVVDAGCTIGAGSKIWHFTHIMPESTIGARCSLGQNVVVMPNVRLGDNVKVQNNVSLYEGVICEDDVFLGPSMVFTNVSNPRSHVSRRDCYETTLVRQGASIGANATIVCGSEIGRYAFIGAGSVVTKDVPPHALVYGNPGRVRGWMCQCGVRLPFAVDDAQEDASCAECGTAYLRNASTIEENVRSVRAAG